MSNATQPSESDFHDSHPVNDSTTDPKTGKATQSIGDLTSIESEVEIPSSHSIGDLSKIEESQSEILGDISLLDEAFAEMEDTSLPTDTTNDVTNSQINSEDANKENAEKVATSKIASEAVNSKIASEIEASEALAESNTDIPVLNDSIEAPTESKIISPETMAASVPLLDQEATDFAEMLKPASSQSNPITPENTHSKIEKPETSISNSQIPTDKSEALFDSADAHSNANINDLDQSLAMAAEMLSETLPSGMISGIDSEPSDIPQSTIDNTAKQDSQNIATEESALIPDLNDEALEALLKDDVTAALNNSSHINTSISSHSSVAGIVNSEINDDDFINSKVTSVIANDSHSDSVINTTSIDEKIAMATAISEFEINEQPIGSSSQTSEFPTDFAEGLIASQTASQTDSFGEKSTFSQSDLGIGATLSSQLQAEKDAGLNSLDISEFNPDEDLEIITGLTETQNDTQSPNSGVASQAVTQQASHSIGITGQGGNQAQHNLNINIPFELHSQLSQKIDELVVDATSSITEELHTQLTNRLDSLLGNAVESVLPKLVNQMATELRHEINGQVKQQLPNIINEVLNKTRLQK